VSPEIGGVGVGAVVDATDDDVLAQKLSKVHEFAPKPAITVHAPLTHA